MELEATRYDVLGIRPTKNIRKIKCAYKKISIKTEEIESAYFILSNRQSQIVYNFANNIKPTNIVSRLWRWFINLMKMMLEIVKGMKSWQGILSLFISFMIFEGWAFVLLIIGVLFKVEWMIAVGTGAVLFWLGPMTPLIPLIILIALAIQRYVFRDRSNEKKLLEHRQTLNDERVKKKELKKRRAELKKKGDKL